MHSNRKMGHRKIYLFLDFDGVINVFYPEGTPEYEAMMQPDSGRTNFADPASVHHLDQFIADYPVQVIITSSWRTQSLAWCVAYLKEAGLKNADAIVDTTQAEILQEREKDITEYLLAHPDFCGFLIFDDMKMPDFEDYLIRTDETSGWNDERDRQARNLMKKF